MHGNLKHSFVSPARRQGGLSIIEMMIAMTIGIMILAALTATFVNSSTTQRELLRTAQQIENGRYALDTMIQDLHLAGFYGAYTAYNTPGSLTDPCDTTAATMLTGLGLPVQGYTAGSTTAKPTVSTECDDFLTTANLQAGSDVIVVRYAETSTIAPGTATSATQRYLQANATSATLDVGGGTTTCTSDMKGVNTLVTRKCALPNSGDVCSATCTAGTSPAAEIRKMNVRIYFVAPCSVPASGTLCTGSTDDGGTPIPTLKRLELTSSGFSIVPVAEGVEIMKLQYGIDDSPTTTNGSTGKIGDGVPDSYVLSPSLAQYANVVSARIDLLVRNPEKTTGHVDTKTYSLGILNATQRTQPAITVGPYNDSYRRHVYNGETRFTNLSGRREAP
jgi:type IV pilus assembly protein PilW